MTTELIATCKHCGHSDKADDFKKIKFDKGDNDGVVICPNDDCEAIDDVGVWLSWRRI